MVSIGIIGGGPGGLASLKIAKENGLDATLYEKQSTIGGIWAPNVGKTWDSMHTNLSHFSCMFSDFPWTDTSEIFPNQSKVYKYLCDYSNHFNLNENIKTSHTVYKVEYLENDKSWNLIIIDNNGKEFTKNYSHIIISIGIFSKVPIKHSTPGLDYFIDNGGKVLSGSTYKRPNEKLKNVMVIGGSYSGCEISSEVCKTTDQLVNVISRPYWYLPKMVQNKPIDVVLYSRERAYNYTTVSDTEAQENRIKFLKNITDSNGQIQTLQVDTSLPVFSVITPHYLEMVKEKKIQIIYSSQFKGFNQQGLAIFTQLNDSQQKEIKTTKFDQVIYCDGYRCNLEFLPKDVLKKISYDPDDKLVPFLSHKGVFTKDFETLFFVGMHKGSYFCSMELEARWVSMILTGRVTRPPNQEIEQGILDQKTIREKIPREQFPMSGSKFVDHCDYIAKKIGILPQNLNEIKIKDPQLFDMLFKQHMSPVSFRLWNSIYIDPLSFSHEPNPQAVKLLKQEKNLFYNSSSTKEDKSKKHNSDKTNSFITSPKSNVSSLISE